MATTDRLPAREAPAPASSGAPQTAYQRALESGDLAELNDMPINRLIQKVGQSHGGKGVLDELGALRIVLTRLVTEQDDLDLLTANVTRVASVALHAARTQRLVGEGVADLVSDALDQIIDEIRRDRQVHAGSRIA